LRIEDCGLRIDGLRTNGNGTRSAASHKLSRRLSRLLPNCLRLDCGPVLRSFSEGGLTATAAGVESHKLLRMTIVVVLIALGV